MDQPLEVAIVDQLATRVVRTSSSALTTYHYLFGEEGVADLNFLFTENEFKGMISSRTFDTHSTLSLLHVPHIFLLPLTITVGQRLAPR